MAYASLDDLLGRAGRLQSAWDDNTQPSLTDLERFLETAAGEIDAALAAVAVNPVPVVDALGVRALAGLNADLALLTAIDATWPGGRGGDDVDAARKDLKDRVGLGPGGWTVEANRPPVVAYLVGLATGDVDPEVADASDFWDEESDYGLLGSPSQVEAATVSPYTLPGFAKGMKL